MLCSRVVACRLRAGVRPFLASGRKGMASAEAPEAILEEVGTKGIITLNRPKALNSLNHNMIKLIYPKLKEWEGTKSMVIIKG